MNSFINSIKSDIQRREILPREARILCCVSGGADSVCLLLALLELRQEFGWTLAAGHFNHQMRPAADDDEKFVRNLCTQHQVPLVTGQADGLGPGSSEAEARSQRLRFLRNAADSTACSFIATGHTASDRAETVLHNLARGTGLAGLRGIAWKNGEFVRPLLGRSRQEVRDWLTSLGQLWREDQSNLDVTYTRNRIRHRLLPMLRDEYNPAVEQALVRLADSAAEDAAALDAMACSLYKEAAVEEPAFARVTLQMETLRQAPAAVVRRVIRMAIGALTGNTTNVTWEMTDRVLPRSDTGLAGQDIGLGLRAESAEGRLVLAFPDVEPLPFDHPVTLAGPVEVAEIGWVVDLSQERPDGVPVIHVRADDASALRAANWQPGDRMRPRGVGGTKKLQDIFTDSKVPRHMRRRIPIIHRASEIIWVPGVAVGENVEIPEGHPGLWLRAEPHAGEGAT